jgi:hypothetical protein
VCILRQTHRNAGAQDCHASHKCPIFLDGDVVAFAMADDEQKASAYRKRAATFLAIAKRMSRHEDRVVLLRWAEQWLELAREAATEEE